MGCTMGSLQVYPGEQLQKKRTSELFAMHGGADMVRESISLPLTEREIFTLTKSWKVISKTLINTGVAIFIRMFEGRKDVKLMFEQFRTVDEGSLQEDRALENHAMLVMNALDEAMANLDDEEYLVDMLLVTGKSHRRFEDFNESIFWAIEEPFCVAVNQTIPNSQSSGVDKIYKKIIQFILELLIMGFKYDFPERANGGSSPIG